MAPSAAQSTSEPTSRRAAIASTTLLALAPVLLPRPAIADTSAPSPPDAPLSASLSYTDAQDGFTIQIPSGWSQGSGDLGGPQSTDPRSRFSNAAGLQRVVAWVPSDASDVSLAITVRTPGADFTSLGSYGTAQDFGERIIAQMDRSFLLKGPAWAQKSGADAPTVARLLEARESRGQYIIQYSLGKAGEPSRVVVSAVALGTTPKGFRRFFTVTGSCREEEAGKYGAVLREAVESFTPPGI